jgi:hypothetical protein
LGDTPNPRQGGFAPLHAPKEVQEISCRESEEPVSKPFVPVNIETQAYEWG